MSTQIEQPPIDNEHAAPGCEQFGPKYAGDPIRETKWLRQRIDSVIQELRAASGNGQRSPDCPTRSSRERSLALTKLQEAVMWLGIDLKAINEESPGACENPYPNSKDPSSTKIDPTADGLRL